MTTAVKKALRKRDPLHVVKAEIGSRPQQCTTQSSRHVEKPGSARPRLSNAVEVGNYSAPSRRARRELSLFRFQQHAAGRNSTPEVAQEPAEVWTPPGYPVDGGVCDDDGIPLTWSRVRMAHDWLVAHAASSAAGLGIAAAGAAGAAGAAARGACGPSWWPVPGYGPGCGAAPPAATGGAPAAASGAPGPPPAELAAALAPRVSGREPGGGDARGGGLAPSRPH